MLYSIKNIKKKDEVRGSLKRVLLISVVFSAIFVSTISTNATVIEYDDDGEAKVFNPLKAHEEASPADINKSASIKKSLEDFRPRRLSRLNARQLTYRDKASQAALRYAKNQAVVSVGLDTLTFVDLFTALIQFESNYDPKAVSPKGAQGLGQLTPDTAKFLKVRDAFDPDQNLEGSVRYLTFLLNKFKNVELALAGYNAGPGRVEQYQGIPPFDETRQYIVDIFNAIGIKPDLDIRTEGTTRKTKTKNNQEPELKTGEKSVWEF